jgi:hypothetical protein
MRRVSRLALAAAVLHLAALGCIAVVLLKWNADGIEGAYFDRAVSEPGAVGYAPLETFEPVPWLVAAGALLVGGTAAFIADAGRAPRRDKRL